VKSLVRGLLIVIGALFVSYIVWGGVEAYRLDREVKAIAARGEPIDLSSLTAPLPTEAHREAARLYADAAARAREIAQQDFAFQRIDVDAVVGQVLKIEDLEATYRPDAPALQLLDRATPLPFAGFGDTIDGPEWINTAGLQALGALAALRADLFACRGDGDAAVRALVAAVGVQRTLPDSFNRYYVGARQFGSLRILLRHAAPSEASLEALQRTFADLPDTDGLERELTLRRARLIEEQTEGVQRGGPSPVVAFVLRPFFTRMLRVQLQQFPEVIAAAREPWPDKFATLSTLAAGTMSRANGRIVSAAVRGDVPNLAALAASPIIAGQILAMRRVAVATLAIARFRRAHGGALPPSLDALVPAFLRAVPIDPFTGKRIVYRPLADGYVVYSVDANRTDDGGQLYGTGSLNPMPLPKIRDFGIKVPLASASGQ
jgi:hypothetical protein